MPLVVANTADFDADGDIDGRDFLTWQRGFGAAGDRADGDADGDSFVDADDLGVWRSQFNGTSATGAAAAVPEPTGVVAFLLAAMAPLAARRRPVGGVSAQCSFTVSIGAEASGAAD